MHHLGKFISSEGIITVSGSLTAKKTQYSKLFFIVYFEYHFANNKPFHW